MNVMCDYMNLFNDEQIDEMIQSQHEHIIFSHDELSNRYFLSLYLIYDCINNEMTTNDICNTYNVTKNDILQYYDIAITHVNNRTYYYMLCTIACNIKINVN